MPNLKTYVQLFSGMALFGSATPLSKLVTQDFPVFIAGGFRVLMAFLILLPFIRLSDIRSFKGKDRWILAGIGVIGVVAFTAMLLYGMKMVSGVVGSIVMSATPAITAGLSVIFFRDGFGWRKGVSLLLAVAGILLIYLNKTGMGDSGNSAIGVVLIIGAIFCEATYTLLGKALTQSYDPIRIAAFSALIGFLAFIPPALWQFRSFTFSAVGVESWAYLVAYGVGTMGIGSVLWYKGVKQVEGSTAATFMGVMPISALIFSYVLLGETFEWTHLVGFGLVFTGVVLVISAHRKMS